MEGRTALTAFNHWMGQLCDTGYLHNHARMWFAGIWVYELGLPWPLGADVFARHLLDRDPASNTLSWRWVSGLHTRGKRYRPAADNIRKYTGGRLDPSGELSPDVPGPEFRPLPEPLGIPVPDHAGAEAEEWGVCREDFALDLPVEWMHGVRKVWILDPVSDTPDWPASFLSGNGSGADCRRGESPSHPPDRASPDPAERCGGYLGNLPNNQIRFRRDSLNPFPCGEVEFRELRPRSCFPPN